jgi:transcriptional regulator with GAF, ATPase, and Fis domain
MPHNSTSAASQALPSPTLEDVERRHILSVLEQTGWIVEGAKGAAKVLNLHPNTLRSRMKKLGIQRSI